MIRLKLNKNNIILDWQQSESGNWSDLKEDEKVINDDSLNVAEVMESVGYKYNSDTKTITKPDSIKFTEIRNQRNILLANSDYTQLADSTYPSTQDAWKTYRQELRDITKGVTDPDTIVFPEEPK